MNLQNKNYLIYRTPLIMVLLECARDMSGDISSKTEGIRENSRNIVERFRML